MEALRVPIIIVINGLLALLLLYYASIQLPIAGLMIGALMPLPTILVIHRSGWLAGSLLVGAGISIIYYAEHFFGFKAELLPFLQMAAVAFILSLLMNWQDRLEVVIGGTAILVAILEVGVFSLHAWQQNLTPIEYLQQAVQEFWTAIVQLLQKEHLLEKEMALSGLNAEVASAYIIQITPALLLINNMVVVLLNYVLSQRLGDSAAWRKQGGPLSCWDSPGWLVFIFIGAGFLLLAPIHLLNMIGVNLLLLSGMLYFFQGLAIIVFIFQRFQVPRFFRWSSYVLLVLIKPAIFLVVLIGLTDLWFDFRHLHRPPPEL
ncbi:DUF2232 domain-containing protein [Desulfobacca acetoxidans]